MKDFKKIGQNDPFLCNFYSMMQSDRNSFCGEIVLDSVNMASKDKDSFSEQIYKRQMCPDLYYDDFKFS